MTETPGGHGKVPALAAGLPRVALPEWEGWQIESVGTSPAPEIVEFARVQVARHGWMLIRSYVRRYVYSVGLTRVGLPELVMRLGRATTQQVQEALGELVTQSATLQLPFEAGQAWVLSIGEVTLLEIGDAVAVRICAVAAALYGGGGPIRAVEVVLT